MRRMMILKIEGTRSSEALDAALRRLTSRCRNTWTGARSTVTCCTALCSAVVDSTLFLQPFFTLPFLFLSPFNSALPPLFVLPYLLFPSPQHQWVGSRRAGWRSFLLGPFFRKLQLLPPHPTQSPPQHRSDFNVIYRGMDGRQTYRHTYKQTYKHSEGF